MVNQRTKTVSRGPKTKRFAGAAFGQSLLLTGMNVPLEVEIVGIDPLEGS
jgi:hypothetical protein